MRDSEDPEEPEDPGEVDKEALEAKIAEAEELNEEDYTEDSWAELEEALEAARAVVADEDATQEGIEEAYTNLVNAIERLEPVEEEPEPEEVDKSELEAKIEEVADLNEQEYTEGSWANLQTALQAAISVFENDDATQAEVDEALDNLIAAIDGLKPVEEEPEMEIAVTFYHLIIGNEQGPGYIVINELIGVDGADTFTVTYKTSPDEKDGSKYELTTANIPIDASVSDQKELGVGLMVWNAEDPLIITIYDEEGEVIYTFNNIIPEVFMI